MNSQLQAECDAFCDRFPQQMALAEQIWLASWAGKHWGPDGAIALSESMYRTIGSREGVTQVLSAHYAAFGHAAKKVLSGRVWYIFRAFSALFYMLENAKFLQHGHEVKILPRANLQVLIAVYNRMGEICRKIHWHKKSDDYFRKAYDLAKPYLIDAVITKTNDSMVLLGADMLSNPLLDPEMRVCLIASCNLYVDIPGKPGTVKLRCLRALGRHDEAVLLAKELGLDDQILKSS